MAMAALWIVVGILALVILLTSSTAGLTWWALLLSAPLWVIYAIRTGMVIVNGTATIQRGLRRQQVAAPRLELPDPRSVGLQLAIDGRTVVRLTPLQSVWLDGVQVRDVATIVSALQRAGVIVPEEAGS